ncbi:hypothetical protein, partial [Escherichia coli]|uniref:hypothetical protein n=1 Tax=Escherichia coli TaxID=562 RepID=UPI0019618009
ELTLGKREGGKEGGREGELNKQIGWTSSAEERRGRSPHFARIDTCAYTHIYAHIDSYTCTYNDTYLHRLVVLGRLLFRCEGQSPHSANNTSSGSSS